MADETRRPALDVDGKTAPPRSNGELVFEAPWESRVFGVTMALYDTGRFEWDEFRAYLIEEIERWELESEARPDLQWSYYARWQSALERLLASKGLCDGSELAERARALAARPPGHDHSLRSR